MTPSSEAKDRLMEAFDATQECYEKWQAAKARLDEARNEENKFQCAYENAKLKWAKALKECSPGAPELKTNLSINRESGRYG